MPDDDQHRDSTEHTPNSQDVVRTLPPPKSPLARTLPPPKSPLARTLPALNPLTGIHKENVLDNQLRDKGEQITAKETVLLGQLRDKGEQITAKETVLLGQLRDKGEQITAKETVPLGQLRTELLQIEMGKPPLTTTFPTEVPDNSDSGYLRRELALREEEESLR